MKCVQVGRVWSTGNKLSVVATFGLLGEIEKYLYMIYLNTLPSHLKSRRCEECQHAQVRMHMSSLGN